MKRSNLKKALMTLMMLAAFIVAGNNSYAQTTDQAPKQHTMKTPEERATMKATRLKEKLNLSSDQYNSVYSSILSAENQMQTLRNSGNTDKAAMREQMKKINISTNESINGTLTSDQQKQYKEWKEKRKSEHKEKRDKKGKVRGKHKIKTK